MLVGLGGKSKEPLLCRKREEVVEEVDDVAKGISTSAKEISSSSR